MYKVLDILSQLLVHFLRVIQSRKDAQNGVSGN